jgi:hypothetical protein
MRSIHLLRLGVAAATLALLGGCATKPVNNFDYTAYRQSRPKSILVLPPINNSPEVNAGAGVLAQATLPLAESGYYVLPVALVAQTFRENGLTTAADVHDVAPSKLREIFGADAALYITVQRYGATYTVLNSAVVVTAEAKLIDLRSGATLWNGTASASNADNNGNNQGGLVGLLVAAVVKQIINNVSDTSFPVAGMASRRLLSAGQPNGLLYGPRSPKYQTD